MVVWAPGAGAAARGAAGAPQGRRSSRWRCRRGCSLGLELLTGRRRIAAAPARAPAASLLRLLLAARRLRFRRLLPPATACRGLVVNGIDRLRHLIA